MDNPLISIIIPVYNVQDYLRDCLDSIVSQRIHDHEVILVDDGSTDDSPFICDGYAENHPQIKAIHMDNGGVSSARNIGLDNAQGEWIWFVDADDWINKDSLSILNKAIRKYTTDIIYFGLDQIGNDKSWRAHPQTIVDDYKDVFLKKVQCNTHQAILYKHDIIKKHHIRFPLGMKMSEDLEFQYKYMLHCKRPIQISSTLYNLRIREGSASHNPQTTRNSLHGNQMILKHMLEYIQEQDDRGLIWMGERMVIRVKNLIKAAGRIPEVKHKDVQNQVRYYIDEFRKIGYHEFESKTLKLAYIDIRIYFTAYKLMKLINTIKRSYS